MAGIAMLPLAATGAKGSPKQMLPEISPLAKSEYVNHDHPAIIAVVETLTAGLATDRAKALAIFSFVRDEIKFGFARGFWDNSASDVLKSRIGFCNTKSTLFVAMLRRAKIPARKVFVEIDAGILRGILNPGTPMVDHSYVEVMIDQRWIATDSYIVDAPLFGVAHARLAREGQLLGYGVHKTGTKDWDGMSPAFAQYNKLDPAKIGGREWGVYADVGDFYRRADGPWNKLSALTRTAAGLFASPGNGRADALRAQALTPSIIPPQLQLRD